MADGAILDRRTLNRSLLARQFLLERTDTTPLEAVEHLVGLQAQVPLDPYTALWSRLRAFDPHELGQLLLERKAVRMTAMRTTLHLLSTDDALRLRPLLQSKIERAFTSSPFARALDDLDLAPLLARGVALVEEEPRTIAALADALSRDWPGRDPTALAYAVRYLIPLVQVTPRGVWGKTLQPRLTTLTGWVGATAPTATSEDDLVLRYLHAFGPATAADVRAWSRLRDLRSILNRLRPGLRVYRDEAGRELYDVQDGVLCDASVPAPVRFLPQYDNLFLAHADRSRIFDRIVWGSSFTHRGSFFVDGFLCGAWKLNDEKRAAVLVLEPHRPLRKPERDELTDEAEALLEFLAPQAGSRSLTLRPA